MTSSTSETLFLLVNFTSLHISCKMKFYHMLNTLFHIEIDYESKMGCKQHFMHISKHLKTFSLLELY